MLGNEMNDFDLQIRSMLEDAEVKPSRRVWKAVSSRIATGGKPFAAYWGWMRWAGACAAFAALVVGVFLRMNHTEIERYAAVLPVETAASVEPAVEPSVAPASVPASGPSVTNLQVLVVPADVELLVPAPERPLESAPEVLEEPAPEVLEEPAPEVLEESSPAESEVKEYLPIEWEDDKKIAESRPLQLYAEGALLANESDINRLKSSAYMSSGTEIIRTGVKELGDSSFGIPFSAGFGVRFYVLPRLAVGLGVNYSYLTRTFNGRYVNLSQKIDVTGSVSHAMQYIGIPVSLSYDFVAKKMFRFYGYGSAEAEYCFSNAYRISAPQTYNYSTAVQGMQWSVGAGVGVEFRFIDWLGIYLDPGIKYYFNCNHPTNIRTDKPLMIDFDLGVRFSF